MNDFLNGLVTPTSPTGPDLDLPPWDDPDPLPTDTDDQVDRVSPEPVEEDTVPETDLFDDEDLAEPGQEAAGEGEDGPLYSGVVEFVEQFLALIYARPVGAQVTGFRWCSHWWEHPEAISRLEALWQAFEVCRKEAGTGPAVWWRDYADPTMRTLCDPDGPFKSCSNTQHQLPPDLPCVPAPAALRVAGAEMS